MELGLSGRACIVTGASKGIGRATALKLAEAGAQLLLVGRNSDALGEVTEACRGTAGARGSRAEVLATDVTAPDAGSRIADLCHEAFGRIDALVNNAGTSAIRPLHDLRDEEWQAQWELNVMAPMRLMRAIAPILAERGWGRIVNVCSSSGKRPSQTNAAYSVTKAAELSLSRAYADAYAGDGVLVNAVAPGVVDSGLWLEPGGMADQVAEQRGISRQEALEATAGRVPIGRFGTPEEIAAVIVFLCSEASSNVTGAAWSVDGGTVPVII